MTTVGSLTFMVTAMGILNNRLWLDPSLVWYSSSRAILLSFPISRPGMLDLNTVPFVFINYSLQ